jgi:MoaA/NifB/PqqE/SkfB family radical SAM enzyme
MNEQPEAHIPVPAALAGMRRYALDGALLLFDRRTGLTAICDGPETAELRIRVPRVVQFAITNVCNLACTFCSRDLEATSAWTRDSAFALLRDLATRGTLEVAFGGGEPLAFKVLLSDTTITSLAPYVGQVRVSVYENVDHRPILTRLVSHQLRFGVNWLVTPARLASVEAFVFELYALGCRDVLLLSYNGHDASMHLTREDSDALAHRVHMLSRALHGRMTLKLDVCWGERMEAVPRLFEVGGCPAGREFVVITSDCRMSPCSFHHRSFAIATAEDVMQVWDEQRSALASPAAVPGCARVHDFGLGLLKHHLPVQR